MSMTTEDPRTRDATGVDTDDVFRALRRMLALLTPRERRRMFWLVPAITAMALLQVVGIASVVPFLQLVSDPGQIESNALLRGTYEFLGFREAHSFLIFTGVAALAVLVLSSAFTALTEWMMLRFSWSLNHALGERMLTEYLHKPYVFYLGVNTSELVKNMLAEVKQVVKGLVVQGMQVVARSVVALFILGLLVLSDPVLALIVLTLFGGAYGLIFLTVRRRLSRIAKQRVTSNREMFKAASESLVGIKDIKVLGMERPFIRRYARYSRRYSNTMGNQQAISQLPRYALEAIGFGSLVLIVLVLLTRGQDPAAILPKLGLYGFAGYRLMPALQSIFAAITNIRFSVASLDVIERDLKARSRVPVTPRWAVEPLPFRERLELRDVTFRYPGTRQPVLERFNLAIPARTSVAFVGATGSGKTTTVDLLLALLHPERGSLVVDGVEVTEENVDNWQRNLGYVPQQIFLADDTIERNIAFGMPDKGIDRAAVERAARMANVHDFIESLPEGYDTPVGERGIRLSGGQRQRLGIARALYHDPSVLVLDEATSALDGVTEESIFQAVGELGHSKTVVMIAHRVQTVRACDVIYVLDRGRIVASGSYEELLETSAAFRALAQVGEQDLEAGVAGSP